MQPAETRNIPPALRYGVCLAVVAVAVVALYGLGSLLAVQMYVRQAEKYLDGGNFGLASHALTRAADRDPRDFRIKKRQGDVVLKLAGLRPSYQERVRLYGQALSFYGAAQQLNPLDAESAYGQARAARRLENLQADVPGDDRGGGGTAAPFYDAAVQLRPNGVSYRYAQLRYFAERGLKTQLADGTRALCRIFPRSFQYLKKEPFWSTDLETSAARGLEDAVAEGIDQRGALMALATVQERTGDWAGAADHYEKALVERAFTNQSREYARMSTLYLASGEVDQARVNFFKSIRQSRDRERTLERLYHLYRRHDFLRTYINFYQEARRRFVLPVRADILEARALIELKRYTRARDILEAVNHRTPEAEAYFWLAKIAQADKQWDAMELAAQKATVHATEDSRNHQLFAVALQNQKKYARAEKAADLALKYAPQPNPWMFNQRAWIRWARKNYAGAVRDWKRAARLKPEMPGFYAHIGEGYHRMGDHGQAMQSYTRAVQLAPENEHYRKRLSQLDPAVAGAG